MEILFRQPIWDARRNFVEFHYWGINILQGEEYVNASFVTYNKGITDPKESQQFIGITNKYEQKIFVGDIVKFRKLIFDFELDDNNDSWSEYYWDVIEFKHGKFVKALDEFNEWANDNPNEFLYYCRVVGNIYQNPELLPLSDKGIRTDTNLSDDIEL